MMDEDFMDGAGAASLTPDEGRAYLLKVMPPDFHEYINTKLAGDYACAQAAVIAKLEANQRHTVLPDEVEGAFAKLWRPGAENDERTVRAHIAQLEDNQRQPVMDEKLREAVEFLKPSDRATGWFAQSPAELVRERVLLIESALSELETLREEMRLAESEAMLGHHMSAANTLRNALARHGVRQGYETEGEQNVL